MCCRWIRKKRIVVLASSGGSYLYIYGIETLRIVQAPSRGSMLGRARWRGFRVKRLYRAPSFSSLDPGLVDLIVPTSHLSWRRNTIVPIQNGQNRQFAWSTSAGVEAGGEWKPRVGMNCIPGGFGREIRPRISSSLVLGARTDEPRMVFWALRAAVNQSRSMALPSAHRFWLRIARKFPISDSQLMVSVSSCRISWERSGL
ncbi:hypothetical protein F4781DRAFT_324614 [Annulohypoxylon bovei var. microspora]|nr:hypothetical protein F4781DRAFT_324614 [Annulohypoxylon bovei var. microspora]